MDLLGFFRKKKIAAPRTPMKPAAAVEDDDDDTVLDDEIQDQLEGISNEEVFEEALVRHEIEIAGGDGSSLETAVVIEAPDSTLGALAEEYVLEKRFGKRVASISKAAPGTRGWKLRQQSTVKKEGKRYKRVDIRLTDQSTTSVFFDVSSFFGKEPEIKI